MSTSGKEVIYIDIDDEITTIIDKIRTTKERIVAVVLPKRASMLQSTVNMKLLKKAAADAKKHIVLITSEAGLLPLAGAVGLHVARTLESKPEIPEVKPPAGAELDELLNIEDGKAQEEDFDANSSAQKPVGELANIPEAPTAGALSDSKKAKPELTPRPIPRSHEPDDTIELDNTAAAAVPEASKAKQAKNKKLKVPDFNKFRIRLILAAALLIILIVGWILANIILPKATVTIATKTSTIDSSLTLNLSTSAGSLNPTSLTVPAQLQQTQKSASQQVATTGQKNEGNAASGSVTMTATECAPNIGTPNDIPAGVGISSNNLTYVTQQATQFTFGSGKGSCVNYKAANPTTITAQAPGANYNVSNATFTVSGRSDVSASGSASGGTDNVVQVVSQADISNAEQKISLPSNDSIKNALESSLTQSGWYAIPATFNAGTPNTTPSASVGAQSSTVSVTETATYTLLGVHQSDLSALINNNVDKQIDTSKQTIQNNGLQQAAFSVLNQSNTGAQITMQATSTVGPNLDINSLKKQIAGKKSGDVQGIINADPGVTSVTVHFSPFWVGSTPNNTNKITIVFKKNSS